MTAITGQNGAGKTTLAQILCGLAKQTRGHILIDGKKTRAAVRRREIYYCGNDTSCLLYTSHLSELRGRNIFELSGGEKQKIAFSSVYASACLLYTSRCV